MAEKNDNLIETINKIDSEMSTSINQLKKETEQTINRWTAILESDIKRIRLTSDYITSITPPENNTTTILETKNYKIETTMNNIIIRTSNKNVYQISEKTININGKDETANSITRYAIGRLDKQKKEEQEELESESNFPIEESGIINPIPEKKVKPGLRVRVYPRGIKEPNKVFWYAGGSKSSAIIKPGTEGIIENKKLYGINVRLVTGTTEQFQRYELGSFHTKNNINYSTTFTDLRKVSSVLTKQVQKIKYNMNNQEQNIKKSR